MQYLTNRENLGLSLTLEVWERKATLQAFLLEVEKSVADHEVRRRFAHLGITLGERGARSLFRS